MSFKQALAGLLIVFDGEVQVLDLAILGYDEGIDDNILNLSFLLTYGKDVIKLKEGLKLDSIVPISPGKFITIKEYLMTFLDEKLLPIFTNFDMNTFVLKKIQHQYLNGNSKLEMEASLNKKQKDTYLELLGSGLLTMVFEGDTPYLEEQTIKLSKKGKVRLFMDRYKWQIDVFSKQLLDNNLNPNLIEMYLLSLNLDLAFKEIFNVDNYLLFGSIYDLDLSFKPNMMKN